MNEEQMKYVANLISQDLEKDKEIERLQDKILKLETDVSIYKDLSNLRQERINKAIKLLEEYLDREYVITDEYFEHIIQILKDDYEYVFVGSDKE